MDDTIPIDLGGISHFTIGGFKPKRNIVSLQRFVRGLCDDKANIAAEVKASAELP